jgi:hypothetical protein
MWYKKSYIMKILLILFVLLFIVNSAFAGSPKFYADCTTAKSHYYWDGLDISNNRIETMYDENVKFNFNFEYNGGDTVSVDGIARGIIVKEVKDVMSFVEVISNDTSITVMTYSINFKSGDVIATHNNNASVFGTQTKVGLLKLDCEITYK